MIEVGKKCKHKNIICDGLCNNCFEKKAKNNPYDFCTNWLDNSQFTDYEGLILASQEIDI